MRLAVLGCGSMATEILTTLLKRMQTNGESIPHIAACVQSEMSAERLRRVFQPYGDRVKPQANGNVDAVTSADVVILAHKPSQLESVLCEAGMAKVLHGKQIISILAGVKAEQIRRLLVVGSRPGRDHDAHFGIIRAMPNMGVRVGESMTLISTPRYTTPNLVRLTTRLFEKIGRVVQVPESAFDTGTVLTGACYALTTIALEGMVDGAVQQGLSRPIALEVAKQCFKGLTGVLDLGEHPGVLRESAVTPGGATITGIVELERHAVRSAFANAIIKATIHTKTMAENQE
ncbi:hypothetical protein AAE478_008046 [Parahypoxylon ruwenzoriense]